MHMKKQTIPGADFHLDHAIAQNKVVPNSNVKIIPSVSENILTLGFNESIDMPKAMYLVAYDKKSNSCIALQEIFDFSTEKATCKLAAPFLAALASKENFKYARLCIAALYDTKYAYLFLASMAQDEYEEENSYVGTLHQFSQNGTDMHLICYYSKGGQLSIKYMESSECYAKFIKCTIETISFHNNILSLRINCYSQPNELPEFMWISKTSKEVIEELPIIIEERQCISPTREVITCKCDFNDCESIDIDAYCLACKLGKHMLTVCFDENDADIKETELFSSTFKLENEQKLELAFSCDTENMLNVHIAEHIYPYMFSIVMAVYNTEVFLPDALDSILAQKTDALDKFIIGNSCKDYSKQLYRNVYEVIMVDDGATDSSGTICDKYAQENEHFTVIHKENGGVSSARNAGIEVAEGKYLNFMDSDDKFSDNVLLECFSYFEKHYEETNVITFPIKFFDASTGDHWLNEKFKNGNRIINLLNEHDKSLLFVNASIFKAECLKHKIWFEESLVTGEDIRFIYSNFFQNGAQFGVINNCTYWYRRRSVGEASAIQESNKTKNYYYEYLSDCLEWLLDESKKTYKFIPYYIQYLVAQQLQWRFVTDVDAMMAKSVLNEKEFNEYKQHIASILQNINTNIILEQKRLFVEHRKYILEMKFQSKAESFFDGKDILYYVDGHQISTASSFVRLEFLKISGNEIYIEGYNRTFEQDSEFYIKINDQYHQVEFTEQDRNSYSLGEIIYKGQPFIAHIHLEDTTPKYVISFYEKIDDHEIRKFKVLYTKRMPLTKKYYKSYYAKDGWAIRLAQGNLTVSNLMYSNAPSIYHTYEKEFVNQITNLTPATEMNKVKAALALRAEVLNAKALIHQYKHKKIWLISDRVNVAGDNGEAFFRYLVEKKDPDIEFYFVINEKSPDFNRLKQIGNVVAQNSKQHKMLHLLAEYIISSQAEEYVFNPFWQDGTDDLFKDLLSVPKFVFLQHGITKDDLSNWLNRFNKDIYGFITAAKPEYASILEYDYYYSPKEVWQTGFPRHDRLYKNEKNYITIMPTWRSYLVSDSGNLAEKVVANNFQYSDFFNFYNRLLNNKRLLENAEKYGYTVCFMPHPHLVSSLNLFDHDPRVLFFDQTKAYNELFAESNLIMTDYSSTVMDFAYLRKPVVYCHFDSEEFFSGKHTYEKGYFEYERDGFGEVTYDLDSVVDKMIDYMENGCVLKPVYEERINNFFAYNDQNNCERVYKKLKNID